MPGSMMSNMIADTVRVRESRVGAELVGTLWPYDTRRYPFRDLFLATIKRGLDERGLTLRELSQLHTVAEAVGSEALYAQFYDFMDRAEWRRVYGEYIKECVLPLFNVPMRYQRKPGVRIQLPSGKTVQYHTDEWYGHGPDVINCWLPLTDAYGTNTLQVAALADSVCEVKRLEAQQLSMSEMNDHLAAFVKPVETSYGHTFIFNAQCVHGTVPNTTSVTRVSIDFRLLPEGGDGGSKSLSEYYEEAVPSRSVPASEAQALKATAYIYPRYGFTRYISPANQRLVVSAFARARSVELVAEETEIKTMAHHPILLDLARGKGIHDVFATVLFSVLCLPETEQYRRRILDEAIRAKVTLFFANEDLEYPHIDAARVEAVRQTLLRSGLHDVAAYE